jgi:hypothetical protein
LLKQHLFAAAQEFFPAERFRQKSAFPQVQIRAQFLIRVVAGNIQHG